MDKIIVKICTILVLTIIMLLLGIGILYNSKMELYNRLNEQKPIDSSDVKIKVLEGLLADKQREKDSLILLLSAKKSSVNNKNAEYEKQNKDIAKLSATATDSLFDINLQSTHKRFDYLLNTKR